MVSIALRLGVPGGYGTGWAGCPAYGLRPAIRAFPEVSRRGPGSVIFPVRGAVLRASLSRTGQPTGASGGRQRGASGSGRPWETGRTPGSAHQEFALEVAQLPGVHVQPVLQVRAEVAVLGADL